MHPPTPALNSQTGIFYMVVRVCVVVLDIRKGKIK